MNNYQASQWVKPLQSPLCIVKRSSIPSHSIFRSNSISSTCFSYDVPSNHLYRNVFMTRSITGTNHTRALSHPTAAASLGSDLSMTFLNPRTNIFRPCWEWRHNRPFSSGYFNPFPSGASTVNPLRGGGSSVIPFRNPTYEVFRSDLRMRVLTLCYFLWSFWYILREKTEGKKNHDSRQYKE